MAKSGEKWIKVDKSGDFMWLSGFMWPSGFMRLNGFMLRIVGKSKEKW